MWNVLMNNRNNMLGISLSYGKESKDRKMTTNMSWLTLKICFCYTPFYIGNIIYLSKIVRALSSNRIGFFVCLQKFNISIATKLCVNLINTCSIFKKNMVHDKIQWLICVMNFLNLKRNWKLIEKCNAQFWSSLKWERV